MKVNRVVLKMFAISEIRFFTFYSLNVNISVDIKPKYLKFSLLILRGTVSQNFNIGFSSHSMK